MRKMNHYNRSLYIPTKRGDTLSEFTQIIQLVVTVVVAAVAMLLLLLLCTLDAVVVITDKH